MVQWYSNDLAYLRPWVLSLLLRKERNKAGKEEREHREMKQLVHDHRESMGLNHSASDWLIEQQDGLWSFRVPEQIGAANLAKWGPTGG